MAQEIPDQRPLDPCRRCDPGSLAGLDQALSRFLICGPVSSHIRRESAPRAITRISRLGNRLRLPSANRTTAIGCFLTAQIFLDEVISELARGNRLGLVKKLGFVLAPARTRLARKPSTKNGAHSEVFFGAGLRPPAEAAASQKCKIIYLQVLIVS